MRMCFKDSIRRVEKKKNRETNNNLDVDEDYLLHDTWFIHIGRVIK